MAITIKLSESETAVMLSACRDRNTTVHAAIGTAALLVVANCGESRKGVLTTTDDLHQILWMQADEQVYSVGGFDGCTAFEYNIDKVGRFGAYAMPFKETQAVYTQHICHLLRTWLMPTRLYIWREVVLTQSF